jgi:ATP-dependent DNA ligase
MKGYIDGVDWINIEPMKYWSFTAGTSIESRRQTVKNAIFGGEYMAALKVDGFYERIIKDEDGNCFMIARSKNVKGEAVDKIEWLPQLKLWLDALPNGTCLLTECYIPGNEGSKNVTTILGCLRDKAVERQRKIPLHLYVFDVMAFNGKSLLDTPYEERSKIVSNLMNDCPSDYVEYAKFYEGEELWKKLQEYLASGREGVVLMRKDAKVYQKRTPARVSIKVKKELQDTIDVFFTGRVSAPTRLYTGKEIETWPYWVNTKTDERLPIGPHYSDQQLNNQLIEAVTKNYYYHYAGSLEIGVMREDKIFPVGWLSNLTEEIKQNYKDYKFKCIEVSAMEFDSETHALRHGKMLQFRDDLKYTDCTYEKYMG